MGFPPIWLVPSHQNPNVLATVKTQLVSLGMVQQKMKQAIIIINDWIMVSLCPSSYGCTPEVAKDERSNCLAEMNN